MKPLFLFAAFLVVITAASAQSVFDYTYKFYDGYYYTKTGEKVEGQIKLHVAASLVRKPDNDIMFKGIDG